MQTMFETHANTCSAVKTSCKQCSGSPTGNQIGSMHFENKAIANIAYPYLKCFGTISHKCCDGMGVVFI